MEMKLVFCVGIIAASVWCGCCFSKNYLDRPRLLLALADGLSVLKEEICVRLTPLPEALRQAAESSTAARPFFQFLHVGLESGQPLDRLWTEAVAALPGLYREDRAPMLALGAQLGSFEAETQAEALQYCIHRLRERANAVNADMRWKAKASVAMGLLGGIFLTVILY